MARRLKFPLVKGKERCAPKDFKCPWCRKARVGEPHSMAMIVGGMVFGPKTKELAECYLNFIWHGGHYVEASPPIETYEVLDIAEDTKADYSIMFCSTACLRAYLNYCVDELESRVRKAKPGPVDASIRDLKRTAKQQTRRR